VPPLLPETQSAAPSPIERPPRKSAHEEPAPRPHAVGHRQTPAPPVDTSPKEPGYLVLDTDPWATVFLGGSRLGTTPLRVSLPPGRHELNLVTKDSVARRALTVVIASGKENRMSVRLR
jgi:hypothetical protein